MTVVTLTGSGSWTCPAGVHYVDVVIKGGGGGGATGSADTTGAGGGGLEGSTTTLTKQAVTPGTAYAYSVGAGGDGHDVVAGGTINGGAGNSSSIFGTSANGGAGGQTLSGSNTAQAGQGTGGGAAGAGTYYTGVGSHTSGGHGTDGTGGGGGGTGTYNVSTVGVPAIHSGNGGNGTITITYVLPTVAFNGVGTGSSDPPAGSKPMTVDWTNDTTNATSYAWQFPGANVTTSTSEEPADSTYATSGNYDVTLTAYNAYGDATLVKSGYVTVYGIPFNRAVIIMADRHRGR